MKSHINTCMSTSNEDTSLCRAWYAPLDFTLERRTLAEEVYPELKEYIRQRYGLELQVSD
ncbi:hypothetical protein PHET_01803 [Paragonimus heterotremus]|uniref:Uncharacterized protein n=1 Tax=Paragonimus heterotremus TaxID=100268 RepID=A0A8J4STE6_9TREM|nr:hypothetical protein PHET_01803 [Paragonimus heterotremus]